MRHQMATQVAQMYRIFTQMRYQKTTRVTQMFHQMATPTIQICKNHGPFQLALSFNHCRAPPNI